MIQKKMTVNVLLTSILYGFGALLLLEWLQPVNQLTDTNNMWIFVIFMGSSLLLLFLHVRWAIRSIILTAYIVLSLQYLYSDFSLFNPLWIAEMIRDLNVNLSRIWEADWLLLTNRFRTCLFLLLIWLITYLIHYWVAIRRNIMLFFVLTVVYLAIIDTFTPYDANVEMITVIVVGFFVLGFVTYFRLSEQRNLSTSLSGLWKWLIPLSIMIIVSVTLAFIAPKLNPQWPDPVPFITSYSNKTSEDTKDTGEKTAGYGVNDSRLGGDIQDDNSVVFYADVPIGTYWKIEDRLIYTGKGWEDTKDDSADRDFPNDQDVSLLMIDETEVGVRYEEMSGSVKVEEFHYHIPYPEPSAISKLTVKNAKTFVLDNTSNQITSYSEKWGRLKAESYDVNYLLKKFDTKVLQQVVVPSSETNDPTVYTQLPSSLPQRVRELAQAITSNQDNMYDKVKAIEDYFDQPDFVYDKENIPYPDDSQDYVDQFLFETRRGYCNNYSTSMVVLLRSLGISSRWTKGYTAGTSTLYEGESVYKVTNNNAHSWVEVYFPGTGWVPFEPTKGFTNSNRFYASTESTGSDSPNVDSAETPQNSQNTEETEKTGQANADKKQTPVAKNDESFFTLAGFYVAGGVIIITMLFLFIFKIRRKWMPFFIIKKFKRKKNTRTLFEAYGVLLKQLSRAGIIRPEGQTLRNYAQYVDSLYGLEAGNMQKMTEEYERVLYRGDGNTSLNEYFELWKNLIKKTTS